MSQKAQCLDPIYICNLTSYSNHAPLETNGLMINGRVRFIACYRDKTNTGKADVSPLPQHPCLRIYMQQAELEAIWILKIILCVGHFCWQVSDSIRSVLYDQRNIKGFCLRTAPETKGVHGYVQST